MNSIEHFYENEFLCFQKYALLSGLRVHTPIICNIVEVNPSNIIHRTSCYYHRFSYTYVYAHS